MGSLVVSNHMNISHFIQTKLILTQFPLNQILKGLVAFQAPSDVKFRVRELDMERDGSQCDRNLLLLLMLQRHMASEHTWTLGAVPMEAFHCKFAYDLTCNRPELCLGVAEENRKHFPQCASA